ncbi:MAG: SH3 domain-containing protein [Dehalococcoidia bacterium]
MSHNRDWMPQFNWPVFGPFLGILATLLVVGVVIGVRLWPDGDEPAVFGTNPEVDSPLPDTPGRGGPGPVLLPPAVEALRLNSLSARVSGVPTVRRGPGTQYAGVHQLQNGEEVHVIACSPGCEWYRILSLTDAEAQLWVPAIFVTVNGRVESLPVLTPQ